MTIESTVQELAERIVNRIQELDYAGKTTGTMCDEAAAILTAAISRLLAAERAATTQALRHLCNSLCEGCRKDWPLGERGCHHEPVSPMDDETWIGMEMRCQCFKFRKLADSLATPADRSALDAELQAQDEKWIDAMGWTDLVHAGAYSQSDRERYVKLLVDSVCHNLDTEIEKARLETEQIIAKHIPKAAPDGCSCEPCIATQELRESARRSDYEAGQKGEMLCLDCGHLKDDSRFHLDAPGTNWGAALHPFRGKEPEGEMPRTETDGPRRDRFNRSAKEPEDGIYFDPDDVRDKEPSDQ